MEFIVPAVNHSWCKQQYRAVCLPCSPISSPDARYQSESESPPRVGMGTETWLLNGPRIQHFKYHIGKLRWYRFWSRYWVEITSRYLAHLILYTPFPFRNTILTIVYDVLCLFPIQEGSLSERLCVSRGAGSSIASRLLHTATRQHANTDTHTTMAKITKCSKMRFHFTKITAVLVALNATNKVSPATHGLKGVISCFVDFSLCWLLFAVYMFYDC